MKKLLLCVLLCLTIMSATVVNSAVEETTEPVSKYLPNLYQYTYMVYVRNYNRVFDVSITSGRRNNLHAGGMHGGDNQQFLVMPISYNSKEFYLVPVHKGGVIDISSGGNLYMFDNYPHGGNNQIFYLGNQTSDGYFLIHSPRSTGAFDMSRSSLDRDPFDHPSSSGGNLYYAGSIHGGDNQRFKFAVRNSIKYPVPQPVKGVKEFQIDPPRITQYGMTPPYSTSDKAILIGKGIIPFIYIKNDIYGRSAQAKETPYYVITRKQYWQRVWWMDKPVGVSVPNVGHTWTVGVQSFTSATFEKMTSVTFTASSEIAVKSDNLSATVGSSISQQTQNKVIQVDSTTVTQTDTFTYNINLPAEKRINFALYQLVDSYTLDRLDGSRVTQWTIYPKGMVIPVYYDGTATTPSPKGFWSFEGNANDQSGNNAHGTLANGASFSGGMIGQGLNLSGNAHVDIPGYAWFNNMGSFTISAWINPSQFNSVMNPIISKVTPNRDFVLQLTSEGKLNAHFAINYNQYYNCTADIPVPLNQWTHVAAVWTGAGWKLYQNHGLIKETVFSGVAPSWTGGTMEIGAMSSAYFFTGKIDEVKVTPGELTPNEF